MLHRLRERLTIVLLALLPFHAFLVTVLTRVIKGPNHAPWALLAIWKEALLAVILLIAVLELLKLSQKEWKKVFNLDSLDIVILSIGVLAVVVSLLAHVPAGSFILGLRYDVLPLAAFIVLRRVHWTLGFAKRTAMVLLLSGVIVSGMAMIWLLIPLPIFTALGYADLHSIYNAGGPLAPFQMIGGELVRRAQGPMSGPNQLGIWLLLPWSLAVLDAFRSFRARHSQLLSSILLLLIIDIALFTMLSRSAWIAAVVIAAIALVLVFPKRTAKNVLFGAAAALVIVFTFLITVSPEVILRKNSSEGHASLPKQAWQLMWGQPWGRGLGSAGPASNRTSDACVMQPEGSDFSWAKAHPNLCVFVGDVQVQPLERKCNCPLLTENWYLQFGVEMGAIGFVLSLLLPIFVVMTLWKARKHLPSGSAHIAAAAGLAFIGVSVAALLLHAWEDSAIAFSVWILLASVLRPNGRMN